MFKELASIAKLLLHTILLNLKINVCGQPY